MDQTTKKIISILVPFLIIICIGFYYLSNSDNYTNYSIKINEINDNIELIKKDIDQIKIDQNQSQTNNSILSDKVDKSNAEINRLDENIKNLKLTDFKNNDFLIKLKNIFSF